MSLDAHLSRRAALGGLLAAGGALAVPDVGRTAAPRRGGRIRVATIGTSTADTLDPAKGGTSTDYVRHYMVYNGLTEFDPSLAPRLSLAEDIDTSDHIRWRIRLRKGVVFHDGSPLTPADVVYSLMRHKVPTVGSKVKVIAAQFAEAKVTGTDELEVRLVGPNVDLPAILATSHFVIVKDGAHDFRTANGTGPYRCRVFIPGVRTIATRNGAYWKPGRPYLDEIELIGIPDEVSRVNALLSGDVQLVNAISPHSTKRVAATGRHGIMETRSGLFTNLILRQDRAPTSHPNFVLAMKHLTDRELIKKAIFRGYAVVANDQPLQPGHRYYLPGLPQRTYDPGRAKFLLRQAGLLNVRLPLYAAPIATGSVDMASILQEEAAQIGLRLAVNRVPSDGYWSNHWMKHPLTYGNTNPRPTADLMFSLCYKSDAAWNASGWKDARFDQLLLAARGEPNEARRRQMYADMQVLVHDRCGEVIPVFMSSLDGFDRRLKGLQPIPIGGMMGYTFAENVWWEA